MKTIITLKNGTNILCSDVNKNKFHTHFCVNGLNASSQTEWMNVCLENDWAFIDFGKGELRITIPTEQITRFSVFNL